MKKENIKRNNFDIETVDWIKGNGLVPVIVQDAFSMRVLMLGYMNKEALAATLARGLVTFYGRSKKRLWQKGETSGHVLHLRTIKKDCDGDALLLQVKPEGPVCHKGTQTCFGGDDMVSLAVLADLAEVIKERRLAPKKNSYTSQLFEAGKERIAQKVGEEGVETVLAAATKSPTLPSEAADLLYHLWVLLEACDISWQDVLRVLHDRAKR